MKMKNIIRYASFLAASVLLFVVFSASVSAKPEGAGAQGLLHRNNISVLPTGAMRACEAREAAIDRRLTHLTKLADNMEVKFASISARVQTYYTDKVVPTGKTVGNYDALVAEIQTKKDAVTTALDKAKTDADSFSCTDDNPKLALTTFREDMQAVKKALKEYRTSIKNLIVAVHSVTGEENKDTPTPTPTLTPTPTP